MPCLALPRRRGPGDLADPRLRHGRPAARQERSPGHGDGPRPARPRALQPGAQARPGRPGVARPRPLRAVQRPRLDPPVLDALPLRLRPRARRHQGLPAVRVAHAGPPRGRATPPASRSPPGPLGQGFGDAVGMAIAERVLRDALRPPTRRPPHLRHRRRRLLHGGRQPRGGVARRAPRPRPPDLRVRRQPGHDRRPDDARRTPTTSASASPPTAGTSSTSARSPTTCDALEARAARRPRPTRRARRCSCCARTSAHPSPDHTDDHGGPRQPVHARGRHAGPRR